MKKESYKLSFFDTLTMAAGFTIGSGIITQTGIGIGMTGRSIFLAFLISAVLFLIAFRPVLIMSSILPRYSAAYCYSKELLGEKIGGLYTYTYFLGRMTISIFGISFAQYMSSLIPALNTPVRQKLVAIGILSFFYVVNLFGVGAACKFQNIMFFVLIGGLVVYIIAGMGKVDPGFLQSDTLFTGGADGLFSASSLLFFAVGGAYIITDFAPDIRNNQSVVKQVFYIVTIAVCVIYMLMGIVASGVIPVEEAANKPLTYSARVVFDGSNGLFLVFIIGACMGALITTLNSSFVWYSSSLVKACEDGWLPRGLARNNRYGVPYLLMTIFYLFGAVPTLLGIDLIVISKMSIGLTILATCIPMAGVLFLDKKFPEEWKNSPLSEKYPRWRIIGMVIITYVIMISQVVSLLKSNPVKSNILITLYLTVVIVYLILKPDRKADKHSVVSIQKKICKLKL